MMLFRIGALTVAVAMGALSAKFIADERIYEGFAVAAISLGVTFISTAIPPEGGEA